MPYTLHRSDGTVLLELADRTINKTELPIALIGRHAANFGEAFVENLIHMLENFAGDEAPDSPISGMIWFDTSTNEMKLWTGSAWRRVVNGSTTATPNTIVERDGSANIYANAFVGSLTGNAATASKWNAARTISLTGPVTGSVSLDGSADAALTTSIAASGVTGGSYTIANITVGADGRITAAANGTVPAHTHTASQITDIDARIDSRTNGNNTVKAMRLVGGPNVAMTPPITYTPTNTAGTYSHTVPSGCFVIGHLSVGTYQSGGPSAGTYYQNYYQCHYVQYYMNGAWYTIA